MAEGEAVHCVDAGCGDAVSVPGPAAGRVHALKIGCGERKVNVDLPAGGDYFVADLTMVRCGIESPVGSACAPGRRECSESGGNVDVASRGLRALQDHGRTRAGGHGVVYSAVDPTLDRTVAIKVIKQQSLPGNVGRRGRGPVPEGGQGRCAHQPPGCRSVYDAGREGDSPLHRWSWCTANPRRPNGPPAASPARRRRARHLRTGGRSPGCRSRQRGRTPRRRLANILLTGGEPRQGHAGPRSRAGDGRRHHHYADGTDSGQPRAYMAPEQLKAEIADGRADLFLARRRPLRNAAAAPALPRYDHDPHLPDPHRRPAEEP